MKRILTIIIAAVSVLLMVSCSSTRQYSNMRTTSLTPDYVRLNMDLNDMQFLGQTTLTVETRTYFGIFKCTDYVNGIKYDYRKVSKVTLAGKSDIKLSGDMKKAAYKVLEEYPDADYYVPIYEKQDKDQMFLGNHKVKTLVIRAYKLK